jgi:predicted  nucleic acid-binding Zn-ribbon protein
MARTALSFIVLGFFCLSIAVAAEKATGPAQSPKPQVAMPVEKVAKPQVHPETPQAKRIAEIQAEITTAEGQFRKAQQAAEKARGAYLQAQGKADGLKQKVEWARKRLTETIARGQAEEKEAFARKMAMEREQNLAKQLGAMQQKIAQLEHHVAELTARAAVSKPADRQVGERKEPRTQQAKQERKQDTKAPSQKPEPKK